MSEKTEWKFGIKEYFKSTPNMLRKLGDALLAVSLFISGIGAIAEMKWLTIAMIAIGGAGKFLTNFFSDAE